MKKGRPVGIPKTGGRQKGSPNRITGQLKQAITSFLEDHWPQFEADFQGLEPEKRLTIYEKLIRYVVPPATDELTRLTPDELERLIEKLKNQYNNEKKIRIA